MLLELFGTWMQLLRPAQDYPTVTTAGATLQIHASAEPDQRFRQLQKSMASNCYFGIPMQLCADRTTRPSAACACV